MFRRLFLSLALMMMCFMATPLAVLASDPFSGVDCGSGQNSKSAVCASKTSEDPIAGTDGILMDITDIIAIVAGAAAIIVIIVSGIRFVTSGGDSAKVAAARGGVINALIGILIIVIAKVLIFFVLKSI